MVQFYNESNQELYNLMRETKPDAPAQQPNFDEFEVQLFWGWGCNCRRSRGCCMLCIGGRRDDAKLVLAGFCVIGFSTCT